MNYLIQTINGEIRHDFSFTLLESIRYQNWNGNTLSHTRCELDDVCNHGKENVPVGSVEFVVSFMKHFYGNTPRPRNVPEGLFRYAGREIINGSHEDAARFVRSHNSAFVKSNTQIKSPINGMFTFANFELEAGEYQASEIVDIESEYRCFVHRNKLVGIQHYSGDFRLFPYLAAIDNMIVDFKEAPIAYTLDVGISDGNTIIIEVHDFFSCGLYGFSDHRSLPYMFSQWWHEYARGLNGNAMTATATRALTKGGVSTDTTVWRGGYVSDNFDTYYLDENMVKHKTKP